MLLFRNKHIPSLRSEAPTELNLKKDPRIGGARAGRVQHSLSVMDRIRDPNSVQLSLSGLKKTQRKASVVANSTRMKVAFFAMVHTVTSPIQRLFTMKKKLAFNVSLSSRIGWKTKKPKHLLHTKRSNSLTELSFKES